MPLGALSVEVELLQAVKRVDKMSKNPKMRFMAESITVNDGVSSVGY